jgi:hypothetical protein
MIKITLDLDDEIYTVTIPEPTGEQKITYWSSEIGNVASFIIEKTLEARNLK